MTASPGYELIITLIVVSRLFFSRAKQREKHGNISMRIFSRANKPTNRQRAAALPLGGLCALASITLLGAMQGCNG